MGCIVFFALSQSSRAPCHREVLSMQFTFPIFAFSLSFPCNTKYLQFMKSLFASFSGSPGSVCLMILGTAFPLSVLLKRTWESLEP